MYVEERLTWWKYKYACGRPHIRTVSQGCVGGARRQHADVLWERIRGGLTAVWQRRGGNHLIDVHAVARQRASRRQVVGSQECGDDTVPVHLSYRGAIHKINQAALVHGDACWQDGREKGWGGVGGEKCGGYAASQLAWLSGQNTVNTCVKLGFLLFRSLEKAQPSIIHGLLFCYLIISEAKVGKAVVIRCTCTCHTLLPPPSLFPTRASR